MKTRAKILYLLLGIFLLTGCNTENEKLAKTCEFQNDETNFIYKNHTTYKIYSTNDQVTKVEQKEEIESEDEDMLNYFQSTLKQTYKEANERYEGYTYEVTRENNTVISNVTIDYTKINLDRFLEDNPNLKSYVKKNKMTTDGLVSLYQNLGAKCK